MRQAFIQRLKDRAEELKDSIAGNHTTGEKRYLEELNAYITPEDLLHIVTWALRHVEGDGLARIKAGDALHFARKHFGLPRSFSILYTFEEEYALILETKSKLIDENKDTYKNPKPIIFSGGTKKGKKCFRVDLNKDNFQKNKWISLVSLSFDIMDAQKEAHLSKKLNNDCARYIETEPYTPADIRCSCPSSASTFCTHQKVTLYQPFADFGDLHTNRHSAFVKENKDQYVLQLLKQIKTIHDKGYVHQDIKLENILLYSKTEVKLSDYGLAAVTASPSFPVATFGFESPEISVYHRSAHTAHTEYYSNMPFVSCGMSLANARYGGILHGKISPSTLPNNFSRPHPANDMFAFGITLYGLYNVEKDYDDLILTNPSILIFLDGLLHADREQRLTVDRAIAQFEEILSSRKLEKTAKTEETADSDIRQHKKQKKW